MRGYQQLHLSRSACIHFVDAAESEASIETSFQQVFANSIDCAYVDYAQHDSSVGAFVNAIAAALNLEHAPYPAKSWLQWLDDLITLSFKSKGLVIVIDNADRMLGENRDQMFDLIEAFLTQFHHWFEKGKPCHLCLQMQRNPALQKFFLSHGVQRSQPVV